MTRYLIKRMGTSVLLLFVTTTIAFFMFARASATAAVAVLGVGAPRKAIENFNRIHGLDRSVLAQYWDWLRHAARLDLGTAWTFTQSVNELLVSRMQVTFSLLIIAMLLSALIAVFLGVSAATKGGWADRIAQSLGMISFALPGYLIALALVYTFAVHWRLFPATGWMQPGDGAPGFIRVATLPVLSIAFGSIAGITMQIRGAVRDALGLDYVRVLRSRGLSSRRVVYKHVLRNVGGPALTVFGMQFVGMFSAVVIIEQIFAIPGFGTLTTDATNHSDLPALMALVTASAVLVTVVNLLTDTIAALLNPKVRLS